MDWQAFWLTMRLAGVVTAILVLLGLPIAYWIAFSKCRWKFLVEALVALPIVLPPTVLGFYVLIALGERSPLGRWWQAMTPKRSNSTISFARSIIAFARSNTWSTDES